MALRKGDRLRIHLAGGALVVALGMLGLWPAGAGAVTTTVGAQNLALTGDGRGCGGPITSCTDTFASKTDAAGAESESAVA